MERNQSVPCVDFSSHPAFADFPRFPEANDEAVLARIAAIDLALSALSRNRFDSEQDCTRAFNDEAGTQIADLIAYLSVAIPDHEVVAMCRSALETAASELAEEAWFLQSRASYRARPGQSEASESVAAELERDGVAFRSIDDSVLREMRAAAEPMVEELKERASTKNPSGRNSMSLRRKWPLWAMIDEVFKDFGFIEGVSTYSRHAMEFWGGAIEYSHSGQTWWRGCYEDVGIPSAATTYMHIDYGYASPKSMIILSDAHAGSGASSFIPGSHKWLRSEFVSRVQRVLDSAIRDETPNAYYRPRYKLPARRRQLMQLPSAFRMSSHFGDDILDGTELSDQLLSQEKYVTPEIANMALFDGGRILHRGALVKSGERVAMQLIFAPRKQTTFFERRMRSMMKVVKRLATRAGA